MIWEVRFFEVKYPKGYKPGMAYKQIPLGRTWFSELARLARGTDTLLWQCAARLRITSRVNKFQMGEYGKEVVYCGQFP